MNRYSQNKEKQSSRLEAVLHDALQTKELVIAREELVARSLVAVLREKLASMRSK